MGSIPEALQSVREHLSTANAKFLRPQTHILTSELPEHWRSNKSLLSPFTVLALMPVPDGTKITVHAGNEETPVGEVRNAASEFKRQCAKFTDLRFVGKSGRGRTFHLTLIIYTEPLQVITVARAIKVTVDGPRDPRPKPGERLPLLRQKKKRRLHTIHDFRKLHLNNTNTKKFPWEASSPSWSPLGMPFAASPIAPSLPLTGILPQFWQLQMQPCSTQTVSMPCLLVYSETEVLPAWLQAMLSSRATPFLSPQSLPGSPLLTGITQQRAPSCKNPSVTSPSLPPSPFLEPQAKHSKPEIQTLSTTPTTSRKRKSSDEECAPKPRKPTDTVWRPFEATR